MAATSILNNLYSGGDLIVYENDDPAQLILGIEHRNPFINWYPIDQFASEMNTFATILNKDGHKFKLPSKLDVVQSFSTALRVLLELNVSAIHTQITSLNSLVIKAETGKGNVYIEMFFDEISGWLFETVINIINEQQLQLNNSGSLEAMLLLVKQYFDSEEIDYYALLNKDELYELSETALTSINF